MPRQTQRSAPARAPTAQTQQTRQAYDSRQIRMLDEEAFNVIKSLEHPTLSDVPITLKSMLDIFEMLHTKLRDYDIEIDSKIREKATEVHFDIQRSEAGLVPHCKSCQTVDYRKADKVNISWGLEHQTLEPFADTLLKLTIHTLRLILDLTGVRQGSLLDYGWRATGDEGIYLRWHHIDISLVGYTDNQEPIFVMHGNAPPSKTGRTRPWQKSQSFMSVSTEHNAEFSIDRDPVIGIVGIAILQSCCGPALRRAIEDNNEYGKNQNSREQVET